MMSNEESIYVTVEIDGETFQIDKRHLPPSLIERAQVEGIELADVVKASIELALERCEDETIEMAKELQTQEIADLNKMLSDINIDL